MLVGIQALYEVQKAHTVKSKKEGVGNSTKVKLDTNYAWSRKAPTVISGRKKLHKEQSTSTRSRQSNKYKVKE